MPIARDGRSGDHGQILELRELRQNLFMDAGSKVTVFGVRAQILEGEHCNRVRQHAALNDRRRFTASGGSGGNRICGRLGRGGISVVLRRGTQNRREKHGTDQHEHGDHHQLSGADLLEPAVAVIPGQGQRDRKTHDECEHNDAPGRVGPMQRVTYELRAVRQRERRSQIADAPLNDLVFLYACPKANCGVGLRRRW
jgi:hypothetical protein